MKKSRLVNILKTLNKKEVRDLRKWLHSPAHNQREDSILLFEYLAQGDILEKEEKLEKEIIFPYVFPESSDYDDAKMRQVIYFLLKCIEDYLTYSEFEKKQLQKQLLLADVYAEKKLDKYFKKTIETIEKSQSNSPLMNDEYFRVLYETKYTNHEFFSKINRMVDFNLQEITDSLDLYFICLKLKQCCIIASHQKVYKTEYEIGLLSEILNHVENKKLYHIPAIGIYYYGYKSIIENEEIYLEKFQEILFKNESIFPQGELGELYLIAINNSIQKINKGEMSFLSNAFELYKRGFENQVLLLENRITVFTFNNVVLIALRIREFTWAENFITEYNQYLKENNRQSTVLYCQARLAFARNQFDNAMDLFVKVEHSDILLNLNAKTFLLKMYLEKGETKALDSLLDSMRTYVRRKDVVGYHKENYRNIIKYTKKLVKVNPYSKADKKKLQEDIQTASPLTEKKWLLAQIDKL